MEKKEIKVHKRNYGKGENIKMDEKEERERREWEKKCKGKEEYHERKE